MQNGITGDGDGTPIPNTKRHYTAGHNQYRPYDAVLPAQNGADIC